MSRKDAHCVVELAVMFLSGPLVTDIPFTMWSVLTMCTARLRAWAAFSGGSAKRVMTAMRTKRLGGVMSPGSPSIPEPPPVGRVSMPEKFCVVRCSLVMPT